MGDVTFAKHSIDKSHAMGLACPEAIDTTHATGPTPPYQEQRERVIPTDNFAWETAHQDAELLNARLCVLRHFFPKQLEL